MRDGLGEIKHAEGELLGGRLGTNFDFVTRLYLEARNIHTVAVHEDVAVVDHLTCGLAGVPETCAVANVVETALKELEHNYTRNTTAAGGFLIVSAELLLKDTVLETEFLLFT